MQVSSACMVHVREIYFSVAFAGLNSSQSIVTVTFLGSQPVDQRES